MGSNVPQGEICPQLFFAVDRSYCLPEHTLFNPVPLTQPFFFFPSFKWRSFFRAQCSAICSVVLRLPLIVPTSQSLCRLITLVSHHGIYFYQFFIFFPFTLFVRCPLCDSPYPENFFAYLLLFSFATTLSLTFA